MRIFTVFFLALSMVSSLSFGAIKTPLRVFNLQVIDLKDLGEVLSSKDGWDTSTIVSFVPGWDEVQKVTVLIRNGRPPLEGNHLVFFKSNGQKLVRLAFNSSGDLPDSRAFNSNGNLPNNLATLRFLGDLLKLLGVSKASLQNVSLSDPLILPASKKLLSNLDKLVETLQLAGFVITPVRFGRK